MLNLRFRFIKNPNEFCIHTKDAIKYKVKFETASLYIRKVKLIPEIILAHAKALERGTMKYPITRSECNTYSIPVGSKMSTRDNLFISQIPKKVVIGLLDQSAYIGDYEKSPFNFQNFGVNHIALYVDGTCIPHKQLTPNFKSDLSIRSYLNLFLQTGQFNIDEGNQISREEFSEGNCLFVFDLTPDLFHSADHFHLIRNGSVRLELKFDNDLATTVTVLYYAEYQNLVEIDKNRAVVFDYAT